MSGPIITPELVRRYLKATRWTREERPAPLDPKWFLGNHPPVFGISGGLPMLSEVARLEGDTLPELCARLGMLAAAEALRADGWVGPYYTLIVSKAGVDPKAWEAAR